MNDLIKKVSEHLDSLAMNKDWIESRARSFSKEGFAMVTGLMPEEAVEAVRREAVHLADNHSSHWKTNLATTGYTPRDMDVVMSEDISANSKVIPEIYKLPGLRNVLEKVALAELFDMPEKNEELFLSRHTKPGNTHGWHWGDYSYAICWILIAPPAEAGGQLQCVPHTLWDKEDKNIVNHYLTTNKISTYPFVSGDIYFLKTDTTMHRTIPLTRECLRVMLNMSWAGYINSKKSMSGIEWWESNQKKSNGGAGEFVPLGAKVGA